MAKKPETRFKEKVFDRLDLIPGIYYRKIQQVAIRGTLDLILCYRGKFFAWELKVGDNTLDKLQAYEANWIKEAGGVARAVTPETLDEAIEELLNA
jgi:hypothetical protein